MGHKTKPKVMNLRKELVEKGEEARDRRGVVREGKERE